MNNRLTNRIESIDITRGLVMVIMALDHVREFMHKTSMITDPLDLGKTTTALFLSRWVTHICAPAFVFLAGTSAYLFVKRSGNLKESRRFLLTRGLWLLLMEFTLINFSLWTDVRFRLLILEVIGATGMSFIALSLLTGLPSRLIGLAGIIIILSHNLLQGINPNPGSFSGVLFSILFRPGLFSYASDHAFLVSYPMVPWLGIMLAGYSAGELFGSDQGKRKRVLLYTGITAVAMFAAIRVLNGYGDPSAWSGQGSLWFTILSFVNVTKYPPSLLFTLLFTGLTLVSLSVSETAGNRLTRFLSVYGRVPFFYFIVHLFLIHGIMFVMLFMQGFRTEDFIFGILKNGRPASGDGVGLVAVIMIWTGVVALLYPVCRWYGKYKAEHREKKWLKYL